MSAKKKYFSLDMQPKSCENMGELVKARCKELSAIRGKEVSISQYIIELIVNDLGVSADKSIGKKNSKRAKVAKFLEDFDDKKLNCLIKLLDINV